MNTEGSQPMPESREDCWLPMEDAPRDGTAIIGLYGVDEIEIRYAQTRY